MITPPSSTTELLERAWALSGLSIDEIVTRYHVPDHYRHKGWVGQVLEYVLGATAGSSPEPDFVELGIELKTLPINQTGQPQESTFVCAISKIPDAQWQGSCVQRKLNKVLWIPCHQHQIGAPLLWSPSLEQENLLRADWEELTEIIMLGKAEQLTAEQGQVLQVRPKAAHSRILRSDINNNGEATFIVPRGFYLRAHFTAQIIAENYLVCHSRPEH